jgi:hypothetical protein
MFSTVFLGKLAIGAPAIAVARASVTVYSVLNSTFALVQTAHVAMFSSEKTSSRLDSVRGHSQ